MPGRQFNGNNYRYGMNGQEKDDEIFQGAMTAEYWEYDSRLGRRWNIDPIDYPWQSPYACFNNNPILYSDPEGLEGQDYVKDKKTGAVWYDDKIKNQGGVDSEYNKGNPSGQFEYAGKEVKGAYDTNGNMFDGDANGVKSYYGKEVTVTADYAGQVATNKLSQFFRDKQMDRIKPIPYIKPPLATGAIYQSISPFDFWSPANFLRGSAKNTSWMAGFGDDAVTNRNLAKLTGKKGWYDVVVHGSINGENFIVSEGLSKNFITAEQLYARMLKQGYNQGTKIRLISCHSGVLKDGGAFQLSKLANAKVIAPTDEVRVILGSKFEINNGGKWNVFDGTK